MTKSNKKEIGTFIIRICLGISFGFMKFRGGIINIVHWIQSIRLPGFMAYVAGIEVIGGVALIIGFATRYIAALDVLIMAGATIKVKYAAGFMGNTQMAGYELEFAFLSMALFLVINGGKWLSIDHLIIRKHSDKTH